MIPDEFIAEVYRRMAARSGSVATPISVAAFNANAVDAGQVGFYRDHLPRDRAARIVDIGCGQGEFLSVCNALGYRDITALDFTATRKLAEIVARYPNIRAVDFKGSIAQHFAASDESYDVIHLSHVIEHIPKYELLQHIDVLYKALNRGGMLIVRTPNMEGPFALSSYYVTLSHEYGFCASNLHSLLDMCGFDDIRFHSATRPVSIKQKIGVLFRKPFLAYQRLKSRLFGVSYGNEFGGELVATAVRGDWPPYFSAQTQPSTNTAPKASYAAE